MTTNPLATTDPLQDRFERFHEENPHVYLELESLARQWFAAGHESVGMKMLWETLRWNTGIRTTGDAWRLNNSWTSRYTRMLLERHPQWRGRIRVRELRST